MTNQLAIYGQFDQIQRAAIALQQSGYFADVRNQAQAIVKVMAGAELGLPPFASMTGIHIIQGKPVLGANVIATLVKNDPRYDYRIKQADAKACVLTWFEDGKPVGESSFTWAEAEAAGLTSKDNWRKFPSDMLFARAISRGARRFAPGIFGGAPVYTPDEMGVEVDPDGYVDATAADAPEAAFEQPAQQESAGMRIDEPYTGDNGKVSLETALAITNSKGIPYGELDSAILAQMASTMEDVLAGKKQNRAGYTPNELRFRIDAIRAILAHRSNG